MKKYLQNFKDEANKLLNSTEEQLLLLENDLINEELIASIYRGLHTIKGVAGMFDFKNVAKIAHKTENIFIAVQDSKIAVDEQIISIVYDFVDYVRESFSEEEGSKILQIQGKILTDNIDKITTIFQANIDTENDEKIDKTYYILFQPDINFDERGINLETVFSVIESKGETIRFEKPTQGEKIITKFYLFWEYIIVTNIPEKNIAEEFFFEKDEIKIVKLSDSNILKNKKFKKKIEELNSSQDKINIEELKKNIYEYKTIKQKDKKKIKLHTKQQQNETDNKEKYDLIKSISEYETARISVNAKQLDELMGFVSELITTKEAINIISETITNNKLTQLAENLEKISRNIQNNALNMRLIPLESIMLKFKRLVRDLSHKQKKEIIFKTDGTDTELDKTIIDRLAEPLMHIFRNSIDHGIEPPEERIKLGKSRKGKIKLYASHESGNVIIQIHDDGRGINPELIRKKAIEKGLIKSDEKLSKKEIIKLIFTPRFSTTNKTTSISGRGIGMDIIRKKILDVRGEVDIDSEVNLGTYVTIKLPLTLSIVDTLLVMINNNNYLIPKHLISRVSKISKKDLETNNKKAFFNANKIVPVIKLIDKFGEKQQNKEMYQIVYVLRKEKNYALIVDEIIGDHQAVLKPLGEMFSSNKNFSGASILGDSSIALMIDTNKLIKKINS